MEKLTNKEEKIMEILWKLEKGFIKDVMEEIRDEQLHYNTVSTIVRNLEEKGFLSYQAYGKTHQYFPLISKEEYGNAIMKGAMEKFFNNSYKKMFSFFAKEENLSPEEVKELIDIIENKK